ncbi:MAG: gliding motility-associated C-terminal domain-containing protein, partial [Chitinophagaceae bacterium]
PNSPSLNPTSQISICAWVKVKGFYMGPCRGTSILMKGSTYEGPPSYKLRIDENLYPGNYSCSPSGGDTDHQYFYGQGQGGGLGGGGNQSYDYPWIIKDRWYSVVYTYDGNTAKLYVDCKLQISIDKPGLVFSNPDDLFIGKTGLFYYDYWFNGVLDEIRIYDRAINQTEVSGYGGCCKIVNSKTNNPANICAPGTINLTNALVTSGSDPALSFSYFTDVDATTPLNNPSMVSGSGTYFIKGTGVGICTTIDSVNVTILKPSAPVATSMQPTCTVPTGGITVSAPAAGPGIYYSIDQTNYTNTMGIFTGLIPKTYNLTIKTIDGCISPPTSIAISTQPVTPPAPVVTVENNCDGTTTLSTAAAGILVWNTGATSPSITVNTTGSFSVTQTANGCTSLPGSETAVPKLILRTTAAASSMACGQTAGSIVISANNGTSPYKYSIDSGTTYQSSNVFTNLSPGRYIAKARDADGCSVDLPVIIKPASPLPTLKINNPKMVCAPASVDLTETIITTGSENSLTYTYFQDSTATSPLTNASGVNKSGIYFIKGTKPDGCFSIHPVTVSIFSKAQNSFKISPDNSVCYKSSIQLNASGGTSYTWQPSPSLSNPNISNPIATPTSNIRYSVTIKDSTCNDSTVLTTTLTILPLPLIKASKTNDVDCSINTTQLNATGGKNYLWQNGNSLNNINVSNPIAKPTTTTSYVVKGSDNNGCINSDTVTVKVNYNNKSRNLMPTVFTPNGDGLNDCFGLKFWGTVTKLDFSIYNRFGQKIFSTNDAAKCWDGTFKGVPQNIGVYVYVIKAITNCGEINKKGTFTLIK